MIQIKCRPDAGDFMLSVTGHTDPNVCAFISGVMEAARLACMAAAKTHPDKIRFEEIGIRQRDPP